MEPRRVSCKSHWEAEAEARTVSSYTASAWWGRYLFQWPWMGGDNGELLFPFPPYPFIAQEVKELLKQCSCEIDSHNWRCTSRKMGETKQQSKSLSNANAQTANSRLKPGRCALESPPNSPEDCRVNYTPERTFKKLCQSLLNTARSNFSILLEKCALK